MGSKFVFGGALGTLLTATTTAAVTLSSDGTLREVEVIFYDNDTSSSSSDKRVKLPIDNLSNSGYFKYKKDESFEWISSISDSNDKKLYLHLALLASKYIQTQNNLNVIKYSDWDSDWDSDKDQILKDSNCCPCCTKAGQTQCQCPSGKCCYMCLGCYSDDANKSTGQCCKANGSCTWTEFKKKQKAFKHLRGNLYASAYNTYLSPVQVNIKFTDKKFNEIKTGLQEESPSSTEYTPFIGSLTYGFVDYHYNKTEYKSGLLQGVDGVENVLTDKSNDVFFSTIPQKFASAYKVKANDDIKSDEALKKWSIDAISSALEYPSSVIKQYKDSPLKSTDACCKNEATDKDEAIKCLLGRTYVFLSKENDDLKVSDVIKNIGTCCPAAPSS